MPPAPYIPIWRVQIAPCNSSVRAYIPMEGAILSQWRVQLQPKWDIIPSCSLWFAAIHVLNSNDSWEFLVHDYYDEKNYDDHHLNRDKKLGVGTRWQAVCHSVCASGEKRRIAARSPFFNLLFLFFLSILSLFFKLLFCSFCPFCRLFSNCFFCSFCPFCWGWELWSWWWALQYDCHHRQRCDHN